MERGSMYELYHHEDDVGQIQVLPVELWDYCDGEIVALEKHAEKHRDPTGAGWTKMYSLRAADLSLPKLEMSESRFKELLGPHAKQFDKITNPLSEYEAEMGIRAVGFGPSGNVGVIADLDGDNVQAIWCVSWSDRDRDLETLAKMLSALSEDQHLLLVDWRASHIVDLRVGWEIKNYLFGTWPDDSDAVPRPAPKGRR